MSFLHLFGHHEPPPALGPLAAAAPAEGVVVAFFEDCVVSGTMRVPEGRMTDHLATLETLSLTATELTSLQDGHRVAEASLDVDPDELLCIGALGTRGDPARRIHTTPKPVLVRIGPFAVRGFIHSTATMDATSVLPRRRFVPLTAVTVAWRSVTGIEERELEVLLVNRAAVRSVEPMNDPTAAPGRVLEPLAPFDQGPHAA